MNTEEKRAFLVTWKMDRMESQLSNELKSRVELSRPTFAKGKEAVAQEYLLLTIPEPVIDG
jgi:hypothetical protein